MISNLKKKWKKQLNRFHDFYFGIEVEKPKSESEPITEPIDKEKFAINSVWEFKDENPFKRFKVEIKEVQERHVLYRHCVSRTFCQRESCSEKQFLHMYKKI